jgi:hypothetical protein
MDVFNVLQSPCKSSSILCLYVRHSDPARSLCPSLTNAAAPRDPALSSYSCSPGRERREDGRRRYVVPSTLFFFTFTEKRKLRLMDYVGVLIHYLLCLLCLLWLRSQNSSQKTTTFVCFCHPKMNYQS